MSKGVLAIRKMKRKERSVRSKITRFDKINKLEETLQASPKAMRLMESKAHKFDRQFQSDWLDSKLPLAMDLDIGDLVRNNFGGGDYGLLFTLPFAGTAQVSQLTPISHVVDVAQVTSIVCRDDVGGDLDGTWFNIHSALDADSYYVWYDVDSGGHDPLVPGLTAVPVAISSGDNAHTVALATAAALDLEADFAAPAPAAATILCTNAAYGLSASAIDSATVPTGFTITTPTSGSLDALTGKYFELFDVDGMVVFWFDVDNRGTAQPTVSGAHRYVEVNTVLSSDLTASQVATKLNTAVNADSKFNSSLAAPVITITSVDLVELGAPNAGNSGYAVNLSHDGLAPYKWLVVGDLVSIRTGQAANLVLAVVAIDGLAVRLEDATPFSGTDHNVKARFLPHSLQAEYKQ